MANLDLNDFQMISWPDTVGVSFTSLPKNLDQGGSWAELQSAARGHIFVWPCDLPFLLDLSRIVHELDSGYGRSVPSALVSPEELAAVQAQREW
jgi:hypothetical protein